MTGRNVFALIVAVVGLCSVACGSDNDDRVMSVDVIATVVSQMTESELPMSATVGIQTVKPSGEFAALFGNDYDLVLKVEVPAGAIYDEYPIGEILPITVDGDGWQVDFSLDDPGGSTLKWVGSGKFSDRGIAGSWKHYMQSPDKSELSLVYEMSF